MKHIPPRLRAAAGALLIALMGCTDPPSNATPAVETPAADASAVPRFVGVWASRSVGCSVPAWTFRAEGLSTQGEVACAFNTVRETPSGYVIAADCTAEGPPAPYELRLTLGSGTMTVDGGPWDQPHHLMICPPA
ncbi:MAG: hypothetical protein JNK94_06455 [Hyphomonadaceae bacterium]|nr:hypothetical protein [Hyphomonadaceae bacterium]MBX3510913.1 hypothetical protein [Hyphomonadaceae bacterium]